jgi:hypothetical protein
VSPSDFTKASPPTCRRWGPIGSAATTSRSGTPAPTYFHRQCFVSVECEEWPTRRAVEACGADCTKYPEATTHFLKLPFTDESRRKILWDNCVRLYDIPRD